MLMLFFEKLLLKGDVSDTIVSRKV